MPLKKQTLISFSGNFPKQEQNVEVCFYGKPIILSKGNNG